MSIFRVRPSFLVVVLVVALLAGCAGVSTRTGPGPATTLTQARQLVASGQWDAANHLLAGVDRAALGASQGQRYDLLKAEVALGQGDAAQALRGARMQAQGMPVSFRVRLLRLRARALTKLQQPWPAATARGELDGLLVGPARERNHQQILALLTGLGAAQLQQRQQSLAPNAPMRSWVAEALTRLGVVAARPSPALRQPVGTLLPGATRGEGYRLPGPVAVILPLSGPLRATGRAVLQGFFASYFQAGAQVQSLPPVQVYDGEGTPAGALAAYHQAQAAGASRVVGPITRDAVAAVFQQPTLAVPTLALNHPDERATPPAGATEFTLRPEAEARQVARHMWAQGLHTAVVFVSSESFAQRAGQAFKVQFEGEGGNVVDVVTLEPTQVDYAPRIHALAAADLTDAGIFISMRPAQARLLMPQLRLAKLVQPVFATSHIYGGRDNPIADGDLDGVVFCDAPWLFNAQPGLVSRTAMAAHLAAARGTSARLFAFGMDAWSLLPYLDWLHTHPGSYLPGATGRLSEDDLGRIHRTLIWARFDHGLAQPLAGRVQLGAPTHAPAAEAAPVVAPAAAATSGAGF